MTVRCLTPGAVATTLYGNKNKFNPTFSNIFLKILITCKANISCLTSSPTLKIAACHVSFSGSLLISTLPLVDTANAIFSNSLIPYFRTLKRAKNGAFAAL